MAEIWTDTVEGTIDGRWWFHYDVANDVLYVRRPEDRETPVVGEESDDGLTLLRDERTNAVVGLTIVNWWRRFGRGDHPDSIRELERCIEPWTQRLAA